MTKNIKDYCNTFKHKQDISELFEFKEQQMVFNEGVRLFEQEQKAFNNRVCLFEQEQKGFNKEARLFAEEQLTFNKGVRLFAEEQRIFNDGARLFAEEVIDLQKAAEEVNKKDLIQEISKIENTKTLNVKNKKAKKPSTKKK